MRFSYSYLNIIGTVLMLTAFVLIYVYGITTIIPLILLTASLVILITLIFRRKQLEEERRSDERTKKIGRTALSYSWFVGIIGIILLFWSYGLGIWKPDTLTALGILFLLFFGTALIFLMYLSKKGDSDV